MVLISGIPEPIATASVRIGSALANTIRSLYVQQPKDLSQFGKFRIGVRNTATTTALTIKVLDRVSFGTTATYGELTRFSVGTVSNKPVFRNVEGWLIGQPTNSGTVGCVRISNDSAIGTPGRASNVQVSIRRV